MKDEYELVGEHKVIYRDNPNELKTLWGGFIYSAHHFTEVLALVPFTCSTATLERVATSPIKFYLDLRKCTYCQHRKFCIVDRTDNHNKYYPKCEDCLIERERWRDMSAVDDDVINQVLRHGPDLVQVSKSVTANKSTAPPELRWGANTQVEVVFFLKNGKSIGASKRMAMHTYINNAPEIMGVLERARGMDVFTGMSWFKLFNADNAALMEEISREEDVQDEE